MADSIELEVEARRLHLDVSDQELQGAAPLAAAPNFDEGGYQQLYVEHSMPGNTVRISIS